MLGRVQSFESRVQGLGFKALCSCCQYAGCCCYFTSRYYCTPLSATAYAIRRMPA